MRLQTIFFSAVTLLLCNTAFSQTKEETVAKPVAGNLHFYHSISTTKPKRTYLPVTYARPNDQLMSWPDYPLTAQQIERRNEQAKRDNKLSSIIAKDIITSLLTKKKKTAVIPQF